MVGVVETTEEYADRLVVRLVDGRVWERPKDQFRMVYRFGRSPDLFVAAEDAKGTYILLIGGIPGLPEECRHPIGHGGRDWSDAVEAEGLLWLKGASFPVTSTPIGAPYPKEVQFCLDQQARVQSLATLEPGESENAPMGSASTN